MKKLLLLLMLSGTGILNAQTYSYQWAKTGGANNGSGGVGFNQNDDEHILDVAVDAQNNSYYITSMYNSNPLLDGQPVDNYGNKDIVLFSADCQGNIRWKRTIGGGSGNTEQTQKIVLDGNGGLYLTFGVSNGASGGQNLPPRFGDNNVLPIPSNDFYQPQAAYRYGFLLKYNTATGDLTWRKDFQGDVSIVNSGMDFSPPLIDSQNQIHLILGFQQGTHLNGMITVPASFNSNSNYQYYLIKYNTAGDIIGTPSLLPLSGSTLFRSGYLQFMYDETNSRYYLGGSRNQEGTGTNGSALSYSNVPITQSGFLLAFSSSTFAELWRREFITQSTPGGNFIFGLKKDPVTSDIYLSGKIGRVNNTVSFGSDYTFNTPLIGSIPYVMKLSTTNMSSSILWCTIPNGLSNGSNGVVMDNARLPIAFKGNEILFAKGGIREVWGAFPMVRPANDSTDPLLVKLNKDTGDVTGTYEVQGSFGFFDQFSAVAVDNDNNILLGGYLNQQLFTANDDNIPTISNAPGSSKSNFFIAKLATSANCAGLSTQETSTENAQLSFYPNPAQDYVMVSTKNKLQTFEVYSMSGQLVQKGKFESGADRINVQSLASGNYLIKITTDKGNLSGKVIKK